MPIPYWYCYIPTRTKWRTLSALTLYSFTVLSSIICFPPNLRRCCGGRMFVKWIEESCKTLIKRYSQYLLFLRHVLWFVRFYRLHRYQLRFLFLLMFSFWSSSSTSLTEVICLEFNSVSEYRLWITRGILWTMSQRNSCFYRKFQSKFLSKLNNFSKSVLQLN